MIGILTFYWADDYGAMLQAYGLKRQLQLLGEQVEFIPYAPFKLTGRYWLYPLCAVPKNGKLHYYIHRNMMKRNFLMGKKFWVRRHNMRAFRHKYLTAQLPVRSTDKISFKDYKTVFIGSDQVWNPEITVDLDDAYIGNILHRGNCRLSAYGASMGGVTLSESDRQKFEEYVGKGFFSISMREQTDAAHVEKLLGRSVCSVLDPVLLLERAEWEKLGKLPSEQDYILLYMVERNSNLLSCAKVLSAQTGKKIISVSNSAFLKADGVDLSREIRTQLECGPAEFLGYLQNAYCVLTNSFHGTAFSILLEKPFLSFRHSTRSIRQEDLCCKIGLDSQLVQMPQSNEIQRILKNIDCDETRKRLSKEREHSKQFIIENISI